ncbi:hypothetical protein [Amaricoccus tamworthensis]|uniref:hypothetical protein n=1 Tax=Amaricoccus tamworthensis TaxID=57002 RepID=UPI003C798648
MFKETGTGADGLGFLHTLRNEVYHGIVGQETQSAAYLRGVPQMAEDAITMARAQSMDVPGAQPGEDELATKMLGVFLIAKYGSVGESKKRVGDFSITRNAFRDMQKHLCSRQWNFANFAYGGIFCGMNSKVKFFS